MFETRGKLSEAIAASQQALKIQPNFAAACKTLGNAFQGLGEDASSSRLLRQGTQNSA
jgi:hypothetical protein